MNRRVWIEKVPITTLRYITCESCKYDAVGLCAAYASPIEAWRAHVLAERKIITARRVTLKRTSRTN